MNKINSFLIVYSLFLFSSCSNSNIENIEGEWMAEGYSCLETKNITERIKITKEDSIYYGIKLTGDDCIQAGDTSWVGVKRDNKIIGKIKGFNPIINEYIKANCEVIENSGNLYLSVDNYLLITMKRTK